MQDFNMVILGDPGSCKSSMLSSYCLNDIPLREELPVCYPNMFVTIMIDGQPLSVVIKDGSFRGSFEDWKPAAALLFADSIHACVVCFSVGSRTQLQNIKTRWVPLIAEYAPRAPVVVVGTKKDLRDLVPLTPIQRTLFCCYTYNTNCFPGLNADACHKILSFYTKLVLPSLKYLESEAIKFVPDQGRYLWDTSSLVSKEEAIKFVSEIGAAKYVECCAITQEGLKNVFDETYRAALVPKNKRKENCALQ